MLGRSPSTISRELRRNRSFSAGYAAHAAQTYTRERRKVCRPSKKRVTGNERFEPVTHLLRERFSPEQIAGKRRAMKMNVEEAYVCPKARYLLKRSTRACKPRDVVSSSLPRTTAALAFLAILSTVPATLLICWEIPSATWDCSSEAAAIC